MIDKYCKILRQRPYFMDAAATALELWAHGTEPPEQPLDIGSFTFAGQRAPIWGLAPPEARLILVQEGALGLEAEPNAVRVIAAGGASAPAEPVTPEGRFVYDVAEDLVRHHGLDWSSAIAAGRALWLRCSNQLGISGNSASTE